MSDPLAGKYQKHFKDEFRIAEKVLKAEGYLTDEMTSSLTWSENDYEAFRFFSAKGIMLIFYPHKTSAGNYHIRVRDQNSKDPKRAEELMMLLNIGAGHNCTFYKKNGRYFDVEVKLSRKKNLEYGWAQ